MTADKDLPGKLVSAVRRIHPAIGIIESVIDSGGAAWIVGGAVRDARRVELLTDVDIVIDRDPVPVAQKLADRLGVPCFTLDAKRGIIRLIAKRPAAVTIDLCRMNGKTIEDDLARRDFTVNAVAAAWRGEDVTIVDPHEGLKDLADGVIRPVSPQAFEDDPARIVRFHRFRFALDLAPSDEIAALIQESLHLLAGVAQERVFRELRQILSHPRSHEAIRAMADDRVLDVIFPELAPLRGVTQNRWHHLDVFDHTIETLRQVERILVDPPAWIGGRLDEDVSFGISRKVVLKLAALYHDTGKPETRTVAPAGEARFLGHETVSDRLVWQAAARLKVPKAVARGWSALCVSHLRPFNALSQGPLSRRAMYRFLRDLGEWATAAMALALADKEAAKGPAVTVERQRRQQRTVEEIVRFGEAQCKAAATKPPVDGNDIMRAAGLSPGPMIGRLLRQVAEAIDLGDVSGKEEALRFVERLVETEMKED